MPAYSYFPGCALHKSSKEYDLSTRLVCNTLGIKLEDMPDWSCCGATPAHHTNAELAIALATRNLAIAEKVHLPLVAPCPACFNRLKTAAYELKTNPQLAEKLATETDLSLRHNAEVFHLLEAINQLGPEQIKEHVTVDLSALKVVPYYGCLLVRPKEIAMDDPEDPTSLNTLLEIIGLTVLPWTAKVTCCGSTMGVADLNLIAKLSGNILERANLAGADAVIALCPLCHSNLDLRQPQIKAARPELSIVPVLYFTQLLGLAFGLNPQELGLDKNIVNPIPLLKDLKIIP